MTLLEQHPKITIFTTSWCPFTRRVRSYLEERGIPWEEVDVEADESAARQVEAWNGGARTVPTVLIGDRVLVNPRAPQLDAALGLDGVEPA